MKSFRYNFNMKKLKYFFNKKDCSKCNHKMIKSKGDEEKIDFCIY